MGIDISKIFYNLGNLKKHFKYKYFCYHVNSKLIAYFYLKCNNELESKIQL